MTAIDWSIMQLDNRIQLLEQLPKGGVVAEVGVHKGGFSQQIWNIVRPRRLHLIDPWIHQEVPLWKDKSDEFHWDCLRVVQRLFAEQIRDRQVIIHQGFSTDVLELFPNGWFDWIYLDGDHRYAAVKAELDLCDIKVCKDGMILGHDFINPVSYPEERRSRFGVFPAVTHFCSTHSWNLAFQTPNQPPGSKQCPSFVLERR